MSRPRRLRRPGLETGSLAAAAILLIAAAWAPSPYVIERPGPTFDIAGDMPAADRMPSGDVSDPAAQGDPVMEVQGARTYPSDSRLDFSTVYVVGGPGSSPRLPDTLAAWFAADQAVVPQEVMYPPATTAEQVTESGAQAMESSQDQATAAALDHLGRPFTTRLTVSGTLPGSPAARQVQVGDRVLAVDGRPVPSLEQLRSRLQEAQGDAVDLTLERGGEQRTVPVRLTDEGDHRVLGIFLERSFDFPIDVRFGLKDVGGPSAGMMLSLALVDELTPGSLAGDHHLAGTGTIDPSGDVGPIGGIRQKMVGARDNGAQVFLAPQENCGEVVGHVPDGLAVVSVDTLDDAVRAAQTVADGGDAGALPQCSAG